MATRATILEFPAPAPLSHFSQEWLTAAEIADLALPGMPKVKRQVHARAQLEGWASRMVDGQPAARPARQRGGGTEYHVSVLPPVARAALVKRGVCFEQAQPAPQLTGRDALWHAYDRATDRQREAADARLQALDALYGHIAAGLTKTRGAQLAAQQAGVSIQVIWAWDALVRGSPRTDWAPLLLPEYRGGRSEVEIPDAVFDVFKALRQRPSRPSWEDCYRKTAEWARANGFGQIPHQKTFKRRYEKTVPREVDVLKREGRDALKTLVPAQIRSVADMGALQLVNIDGHRWDVFVRFPARAWEKEVVARPIMVAIQDIRSRKVLAWRIGRSESAVLTRLAFADLFRRWGVPEAVLMDNGRAFASKWITGGALNRYRFKVRHDEPLGLLTQLGIENLWATPYHGQAKPIERAFRDYALDIAKHPAFEGAYTGNRPDAKPENYGSKAVPLETFERIVAEEIARHNAREGRRGRDMNGLSFDQVFEDSYASHPIRKATAAELNLALLTAEQLRTDARDGSINFLGNRYWTDALGAHAGKPVTIRFDPDQLHGEIQVYSEAGVLIASAPCWAPVGFRDAEAAKRQTKLRADVRKNATRLAESQSLLSAEQLAEELARAGAPQASEPTASVVRPIRTRGSAAAAEQVQTRTAHDSSTYVNRFAASLRIVREE